MYSTERALADVAKERERQDYLWGTQNHRPPMWLAILTEETGEVAKEVTYARLERIKYRTELIHVAAVAVAAIEALDRGYA